MKVFTRLYTKNWERKKEIVPLTGKQGLQNQHRFHNMFSLGWLNKIIQSVGAEAQSLSWHENEGLS